ncbi:hypothetical protein GGE16_001775 [Rhizobium leguminosarum]|uniref:Ubiquinone biosynthesis methyltransferase UbiE n=1 Tax=Rhizobium leguminosarum TaxID=384 RepID=A0AAE2SVN7_RHILE|nr:MULTISPECIES: hypothetical protein [Rhizobium]MBB4289735.1 hypothetical protein [Rhizobium leguminosarum]MBB4296379.1 hypothetical protein [Rhizobium leguminosarum]MBB4308361.1 hypothetical protein [Rhizobium leguminosarum]MBB4416197.1 hypothetical protein [Rhizobium leguminosarum]MBB4430836.1 hypothetical protein [Rhizobium esperanzae]
MEEEASGFDDHAFVPMVSLEMNLAMFKSRWQLCDGITEYLSEILGQSHSDPARYSNFLSVAANELVELAFRSTRAPGRIRFGLYRSATFNRLRIAFPREDAFDRQPVAGSADLVTKSEETVLLRDLATIFRAAIRIEEDDVHGMQIIADFPSREDFQ